MVVLFEGWSLPEQPLGYNKEPLPVSSHTTSFTLLQLSLYNMQSVSLPAADSACAGRSLYTSAATACTAIALVDRQASGLTD